MSGNTVGLDTFIQFLEWMSYPVTSTTREVAGLLLEGDESGHPLYRSVYFSRMNNELLALVYLVSLFLSLMGPSRWSQNTVTAHTEPATRKLFESLVDSIDSDYRYSHLYRHFRWHTKEIRVRDGSDKDPDSSCSKLVCAAEKDWDNSGSGGVIAIIAADVRSDFFFSSKMSRNDGQLYYLDRLPRNPEDYEQLLLTAEGVTISAYQEDWGNRNLLIADDTSVAP